MMQGGQQQQREPFGKWRAIFWPVYAFELKKVREPLSAWLRVPRERHKFPRGHYCWRDVTGLLGGAPYRWQVLTMFVMFMCINFNYTVRRPH